MTDPVQRQGRVNGVELAWFEWGAPSTERPSLLFLHCTGFHARIWDRIIEAFPGVHAIGLDQRGHGRSEKRPIENWREFGLDAAALASQLQLRDAIGVGHSIGGHALVDAAAVANDAFASLVLCDPTIVAPEAYRQPPPGVSPGAAHPAARRRRHFASAQAMYEHLRSRGNYPLFEPRMLWDYCRHGLLPDEEHGFTLACAPEIEASVYLASRANGRIYQSVRAIDIPVLILRAVAPEGERPPFDFTSSPTYPGLVQEFARARELYLPDCTHFIPMQRPDTVIDAIRESMDAWPTTRSA